MADEPTRVVVGSGDPVTWCLAGTGRSDGRGVCSPFEMAEDLVDHRALRDDGDEPQGPARTKRAAGHIQRQDSLEQPRPAPARRRGTHLRRVEALLTWGWDDCPTQVAVRRQTAPIAHEMDVGQGYEGGQLLQEFEWREPNARGPVRPRMRERVDQIAVGVFLEALQGHGPTGGIADEAFQLIAAMGRVWVLACSENPLTLAQ